VVLVVVVVVVEVVVVVVVLVANFKRRSKDCSFSRFHQGMLVDDLAVVAAGVVVGGVSWVDGARVGGSGLGVGLVTVLKVLI